VISGETVKNGTISGVSEPRQYTIRHIRDIFRAVHQHFAKMPYVLRAEGLFTLQSCERDVQRLVAAILSGGNLSKFGPHEFANALQLVLQNKTLLNQANLQVQACYYKLLKGTPSLEGVLSAINALIDNMLISPKEEDHDLAEIIYTFFQIGSLATRYAPTNSKNSVIDSLGHLLLQNIFSGDTAKLDKTKSDLQAIIESYNFILPFVMRADPATRDATMRKTKLTMYERMLTGKQEVYKLQKKENPVKEAVNCRLPTEYGDFEMKVFVNEKDGKKQEVLVKGPIKPDSPVLVRIHSSCKTGDIFGSLRCDCGPQLHGAMRAIGEESGILIYMHHEGRGIGLVNKIKAYVLQEQGRDTVEANLELGFKEDERDFTAAAQILERLGVKKIKLLTNNPLKVSEMKKLGLDIVEQVHLEIPPSVHNERYLATKRDKMGHTLHSLKV
jgi:GTP cyclohydrolase II